MKAYEAKRTAHQKLYDECERIRNTPGREPGYETDIKVGILRGYHKGKRGIMVRSGYTFAKVMIDGEAWWVRQFDIIQERVQ